MQRSPRPQRAWCRKLVAPGAIVLLTGASVLIAAAPSSAQPRALPANLAKFANCPVHVKAVSLCVFSSTTHTTFQIGSTTVSSTKPATISLGVVFKPSGAIKEVVLPDNGTSALESPSIPLPGGLTGIPGAGGGELAVTATPQLVGTPTLSLANLLEAKGAGLTLPIDVLVSTPTGLLGSDCTIGDAASPITLNLTTGKTNPPSPNRPIKGARGTLASKSDGEVIISGLKLVDNAYAVPAAHNCGPLGLADPILDLDKGLPSAAGKNSAVLAGSSYTVPASLIRKYLG
ncbi:MAG: hypothetical protein ACRD0Z_17260 [Acidimicrobiales bacterium]